MQGWQNFGLKFFLLIASHNFVILHNSLAILYGIITLYDSPVT